MTTELVLLVFFVFDVHHANQTFISFSVAAARSGFRFKTLHESALNDTH